MTEAGQMDRRNRVGVRRRNIGVGRRYVGANRRYVGVNRRYVGVGRRCVGANRRYIGVGRRDVGASRRCVGVGMDVTHYSTPGAQDHEEQKVPLVLLLENHGPPMNQYTGQGYNQTEGVSLAL